MAEGDDLIPAILSKGYYPPHLEHLPAVAGFASEPPAAPDTLAAAGADAELIKWLRRVIGGEQYYAQALVNDAEVADQWEESSSGVLQTGSLEAQDQWEGCWPCGNSNLSRHIVFHDPASTLAGCEAELEMIRLCERVIGEDADRDYWSDGWSGLAVARMTLRYLAYGYRHADGYRKEWQQ